MDSRKELLPDGGSDVVVPQLAPLSEGVWYVFCLIGAFDGYAIRLAVAWRHTGVRSALADVRPLGLLGSFVPGGGGIG